MRHTLRKKFALAFMALWFMACSTTNAPESTATPAFTFTPIDTPANTETPIPRPSATIVRIATWDPNQPTLTPFALLVNGQTITPFSTPTSSRPGVGFASVTYSPKKIFWGGCRPNSVTIRAEVDDVEEVSSVIYFLRVKDFKEEDYTPWTNGDVMLDRGQGEFTITLVGTNIYGHNHYSRSWVYFQLVATNLQGEEIGRTRIYEKAFDLAPCPCLTPLTGCPIVTPRPTATPKR